MKDENLLEIGIKLSQDIIKVNLEEEENYVEALSKAQRDIFYLSSSLITFSIRLFDITLEKQFNLLDEFILLLKEGLKDSNSEYQKTKTILKILTKIQGDLK